MQADEEPAQSNSSKTAQRLCQAKREALLPGMCENKEIEHFPLAKREYSIGRPFRRSCAACANAALPSA
ncbi:hypothetical protein GFL15_00350 [Rhizobium leguminosarum bv. viciae]|nr:hypothetical protein [Rhizobium leguminosarum bv. viciae]